MSSASEKISSPMDELLAMQQSALQANLNKASNIQKAVTLTEANWMGLTRAMELTGNSILKAQVAVQATISFDGGLYRDTGFAPLTGVEVVSVEKNNGKEP